MQGTPATYMLTRGDWAHGKDRPVMGVGGILHDLRELWYSIPSNIHALDGHNRY